MCTAISFTTRDHYFGRNLDLEISLGESVCILPRRKPLTFRRMGTLPRHHTMMGVAVLSGDYPLFFDAVNEHGLGMAGLNFPGNAVWFPAKEGCDNVSPFEFIPWILAQCRSVREARPLLTRLNLTDEAFRPDMPLSPLHWMLSDAQESLVIEQTAEGLRIHDNPIRVLTNNPPFPWHQINLTNYMDLTPDTPENTFAPALPLRGYSRGMGSLGLPGDCSSASRFIRAAYTLHNSLCDEEETASVSQFFHILSAVAFPRGAVMLENGQPDITVYSVCFNTSRGICYYTTYDNPAVTAVEMGRADLEGAEVISYPMEREMRMVRQN